MGIVRLTVAADTIAPTVSLASPGATVSGNVPLTADRDMTTSASPASSSSTAPRRSEVRDYLGAVQHHLELDHRCRRQPHADRGRADAAGNTATSNAVVVTVNNAPPPPPPSGLALAATAYRDGAGRSRPRR
jgi:hypothetical protein